MVFTSVKLVREILHKGVKVGSYTLKIFYKNHILFQFVYFVLYVISYQLTDFQNVAIASN